MEFYYSPLPSTVHIAESDIHGLGLMASEYLPEDTLIGISHVEDDSGNFEAGLVRTIVGALINHSDTPNCILITTEKYWRLWTIEEIYPNYELTVDYRQYRCGY